MTSSPHFIKADNVHLSLPLIARVRPTLRANSLSMLGRAFSGKKRVRQLRQLIRGVSFTFQEGERVGLIGQNGAGKTTLLRLLAGALMPSVGTLEVRGSTQNLLNVSMGMQKAATGLENIYLRGFSSGLSGKEIKQRIPEIIEFADLEAVIDDPVHSYSAGMQLRLAFAVATSVEPEILLLDEWISAGDRFFVERSRDRLLGHIDASKILVFASHSAPLLEEMCNRGLVLKQGKVLFDGDIADALEYYGSEQYREA